MATDTITPDVSSASATPAAVPAAATPTPAATPAATETPAAPKDPVQVLRDAAFALPGIQDLNLPGVEKTPVTEVKPEDVDKPAAEVTPAAEADAGKTEEQKAAEAKTVTDAAKPSEVDPLDKLGPLPAELVGEALKDATFVEALKAKGLDPEILMETSRMAAETQLYRDAGLPTPEAAAFAVENANHFYDIEENFGKVKDAATLDKFMMDVMLPLSFIRDADGKPIQNADGTYKTDGTVNRFMQANVEFDHGISSQIADSLLQSAEQYKNADGEYTTERAKQVAEYAENLKGAVKFIEDFRKNGYKMPSGEQKPQMSAEDKAEMDRLRARDTEVTAQEKQVQAERAQIFATQVQTDTLAGIDPLVSDTLKASSLDDYAKSKVTEDVWTDLTAALQANRTFQQQKAALYTKGMDEKNFKSLVALNTRTAKNLLLGPNGILQKHLTAAGQRRQSSQQQRDSKIDAQSKKDTMNQGARAAASTNATGTMTAAQVQAKARELATADNGGKPPEDAAVLRHVLKLRGLA